jgi:hypothetical protein
MKNILLQVPLFAKIQSVYNQTPSFCKSDNVLEKYREIGPLDLVDVLIGINENNMQ